MKGDVNTIMTCKSCVHYGVCGLKKEILSSGILIIDSECVEIDCSQFKDYMKCVNLPCKVGDYLYRPDKFGIGKYLVISIQILKLNLIDINWKLVDGIGIPIPYIDAKNIGKTVFLTQEEAELARQKYNDL